MSSFFERIHGLFASLAPEETLQWEERFLSKQKAIESAYAEAGDVDVCALKFQARDTPLCLAGYRWVPDNLLLETPPRYPQQPLPLGQQAPPQLQRLLSIRSNILRFAPGSHDSTQSHEPTQSDGENSSWRKVDWTRARGAVVHVHGVTESSLFSLLSFRAGSPLSAPLKGLLKGSGDQPPQPLSPQQLESLRDTVARGPVVQSYKDSWVSALNEAGFVVYAIDAIGHGLSMRWRQSDCNVEKYSDYSQSFLCFIRELAKTGEFTHPHIFPTHMFPPYIPTLPTHPNDTPTHFYTPAQFPSPAPGQGDTPKTPALIPATAYSTTSMMSVSTPIFLSGTSMGGCILTRALLEGFASNKIVCRPRALKEIDSHTDSHTGSDTTASGTGSSSAEALATERPLPISGVVLFCPALSTDKLKKV